MHEDPAQFLLIACSLLQSSLKVQTVLLIITPDSLEGPSSRKCHRLTLLSIVFPGTQVGRR